MTGPALVAGGVLRLYDGGPAWHANTAHAVVGIDPDTPPTITSSGDLTFDLTSGHRQVVVAVAFPDELLTARGITAGVSGGLGTCVVRLHHKTKGRLWLGNAEHYALAAGETANLWVGVWGIPSS